MVIQFAQRSLMRDKLSPGDKTFVIGSVKPSRWNGTCPGTEAGRVVDSLRADSLLRRPAKRRRRSQRLGGGDANIAESVSQLRTLDWSGPWNARNPFAAGEWIVTRFAALTH